MVPFEMFNRCRHVHTTIPSGVTHDQITPSPGMTTAVLPTMLLLYGPRWVPGLLISLSECIFSGKVTRCTQCIVVWGVWLHFWRDNDRNVPKTWVFTYVLVCHVVSSPQIEMKCLYDVHDIKKSLSSEACIVFSCLVAT